MSLRWALCPRRDGHCEAALGEEKAQRATIDAARLAVEFCGEQDLAQGLERERKILEAHAENRRMDDAQKNMCKSERKIN